MGLKLQDISLANLAGCVELIALVRHGSLEVPADVLCLGHCSGRRTGNHLPYVLGFAGSNHAVTEESKAFPCSSFEDFEATR
jgi:hypothetical protein